MSRGNQRRTDPNVLKAKRMQRIASIGKLFMLLALVGGTLFSGWWMNRAMSVEKWQIEGDAQLKRAIDERLQEMKNRDFLSTRPETLRQIWMQQLPDMASVQITRQLPDTLQIRLLARVPAALWQDEKGQLQLFDDQGNVYRTLRRGESPDLPLLRITRDQLPGAYQLLAVLNNQNVVNVANLSEIRASSRSWQIYFSKGVIWKLPVGDEQAAVTKLAGLLTQPRWSNRNWRVDARLQTRWFIRPAKYGGVI